MNTDKPNMKAGCFLCPRDCGADRKRRGGVCKGSWTADVSLHQLHFGEEPVLSGTNGSGTIFFSNCSMRCVYCQNFRISHEGHGTPRSTEELCAMMLELQELGAHNINMVTASHYVFQAAQALRTARERGLRIPLVWNSSAYEKPETLRLLEGLVDIYLPDFRYFDPAAAARYSSVPDYPTWAKRAIIEMFRQTGHLSVTDGIAARGLIIRILVLPGLTEGVRGILAWIRDRIGPETWVSLMGQYYPAYRAHEFPEINRPVTEEEYRRCLGYLEEFGFENGFVQEVGSDVEYTPAFSE
jgi:putative pyruvate formate lyase activating enzyme